ncbi:MAG: hypothetical protein A2V90_05985 [Gammaproteobacteria bacterium RBG_16_57_12]|nr:MAG: hypothetical protein A2V90_05985 [Gammaproteobacteria bacterium RBG_16_57_12]
MMMLPGAIMAGGGPETTLLVVNADSPLSLTVANTYIKERDLPTNHVVWLENIPSLATLDIETFRQRIWQPIQAHLDREQLSEEIDTIAYSADFPYAVDFKRDVDAFQLPRIKYRGEIGSLTGLTYFARRVAIADVGYLGLGTNRYYRRNLAKQPPASSALSDAALVTYKKGEQALEKRKAAEALQLFQGLTQAYPDHPRVWYHLARTLAALDRMDEAMQALRKAVALGWNADLLILNDPYLQKLQPRGDFAEVFNQITGYNGPFELAQGFRSRYLWNRWALPIRMNTASDLDRYYLSTLLAYTGIRGNSLAEVDAYLASAAASDGSHPEGTVYLMENDNIRSLTRQRYFTTTVRELKQRGHSAEILRSGQDGQDGILARGRDDIIGLVAGTDRFRWAQANSRLLPGAIAESLTSYGGHFEKNFQTKLTAFLRQGAAGSSGAVAEPFSIPEKFPDALLHVYYADGSSLAEAFYQSVSGPYQLLIVGDPLARPFAAFATVALSAPDPQQDWRGTVTLQATAIPAEGHPVDHIELWVDGIHLTDITPGGRYPWDTTGLSDGAHELRLVAVEAGSIETRSYRKYAVTLVNHSRQVAFDTPVTSVSYGNEIVVSGTTGNTDRIDILQGTRRLASAQPVDGRWQLALASQTLGLGEVSLQARAHHRDGTTVVSPPATITILPPALRPASRDTNLQPGLAGRIQLQDGAVLHRVITKLEGPLWQEKYPAPVANVTLQGQFKVPAPGFYQLIFNGAGRLSITIDGISYATAHLTEQGPESYLGLGLEEGWHDITLALSPSGQPYLKVLLNGAQPGNYLGDHQLGHRTTQ